MARRDVGSAAMAGAAPAEKNAANPIDLAHMERQTMGDGRLQAEVLDLFWRQALLARDELAQGSDEQRRRLAHRLKGAARGVGAFAVAEHAEAIEADPSDMALADALAERIGEACAYIASLRR